MECIVFQSNPVAIKNLSFNDTRGAQIQDLQTVFSYSLTQMMFEELEIKSEHSTLFGQVQFDYDRKDFKDFLLHLKLIFLDFLKIVR